MPANTQDGGQGASPASGPARCWLGSANPPSKLAAAARRGARIVNVTRPGVGLAREIKRRPRPRLRVGRICAELPWPPGPDQPTALKGRIRIGSSKMGGSGGCSCPAGYSSFLKLPQLGRCAGVRMRCLAHRPSHADGLEWLQLSHWSATRSSPSERCSHCGSTASTPIRRGTQR